MISLAPSVDPDYSIFHLQSWMTRRMALADRAALATNPHASLAAIRPP
jgi:hypothetical protein